MQESILVRDYSMRKMKIYLSETKQGTSTLLINLKSVAHNLELTSVRQQYFLVLCQRLYHCKFFSFNIEQVTKN